jgi:hypothetical protein
MVTDSNGRAKFTGIPSIFSVELTKNHYRDSIYSNIEIAGDTSIVLYLEKTKFNVVLRVRDFYTGIGIWDSRITVGSKVLTTDYLGNATFVLPFGNNEFKIENSSYQIKSGVITISSDSVFIFYLSPTLADVKFWLKTGSTPINNASIVIGTSSLLTNAIGIANFYDLPTNSEYSYSISKSGYENLSGNFYLIKDTTIDINMVETGSSLIQKNPDFIFDIWPNPCKEFINLKIGPVSKDSEINICDILGKVIKSIQIPSYGNMRIGITDIPDGIYIIKARTETSGYSKYFIKTSK